MTKTKQFVAFIVLGSTLLFSTPSFASDEDDAVASCLKSWGNHPFGNSPKFKTLAPAVKVFGMGSDPSDTEITSAPALVLVSPGVNVMGNTTYELLNPNGWYCLRTSATVMGDLTLKAHCKAHLASTTMGVAVMGSGNKGMSVMGSTEVELVDCK